MAGDSRQRPGPRARLRVIIATGISAAGVAGGAEVVAFVVGVDPKWPVAPCDSCRRPQTPRHGRLYAMAAQVTRGLDSSRRFLA
jgi:hypothetical protein